MPKARYLLPAALLYACASTTPAPEHPAGEPTAAAAPAADPHAAAHAEVARLRAEADRHPLLAPWTGPYGGVPPWDKVDLKRVGPAFATGIALLHAEVDTIATEPEPATFSNTIAPLEDAGRHLHRLMVMFGVLSGNLNTPDVQALD